MVLPKGQDDWSKEDIVKLLECMEDNIPSNDRHTFKTTQSLMDWEKVAFKHFSGEMCKLKWLEISYSLRKFRTLEELVVEAKENVNNPHKSRKLEKHPDLPKKPLTAYLRFFKEMRPQYTQKHPKLSNQELTKVLSEEYKKMPEELKLKYSQDFLKEKQEFEEKMALFREQHPDLVLNSKKSHVPKRSQIKVPKKFQGNVQKVKSPPENNSSMERRFHGEPKKPPMNGYHKFHQDLWSSRELKGLPPRERMVELSRRWQRVPQDQKEHYKKQAEALQKQYKVDLDLWFRSLSPEEYAAYREATYTKRKNMSVTGDPNPKVRRMDLQSPSLGNLQGGLEMEQGPQDPETESSDKIGEHSPASWRSEENKEEEEGSNPSDHSSGDEEDDCESEDSDSSSSSSGDSSDSDSS
ncbi:upstream-binding factor 1-like protein 1 [Hippopotamus amphibius kiboko]|uniref:upstream-binding factor 1-like protein 1 n=1 Tax=Hippopotamus amphibius kiboko TaxID=575201 RepID=UPI00259AAB17|nr:upstream-binding factor 1-like protein 1 [Hippopotamus amphibius kiboko]